MILTKNKILNASRDVFFRQASSVVSWRRIWWLEGEGSSDIRSRSSHCCPLKTLQQSELGSDSMADVTASFGGWRRRCALLDEEKRWKVEGDEDEKRRGKESARGPLHHLYSLIHTLTCNLFLSHSPSLPL
ncbi:hypothetical protein ISN44_As07g010560 [Arabidopsis suecica]|uniref:Uncharacterized protein n=1 Tax=Arabidopsis suecica TaxID=45249 RepID=A0A8T2BRV0_ARASU|nr:hypothetical protein ISN44_As07g010560 [Arabidopsis suecica]